MNKIATAPISWGVCEIPEWGDLLQYEQVLDEIAAAGYEGTELGPFGYLPTDRDALRRELEKRSLTLVGAFYPVRLNDVRTHAAVITGAADTAKLLADLGASVLVLADAGDDLRAATAGNVPADGSASFAEGDWLLVCGGVNEIALRAREHGVVTAFHPHAGTYVEAPHEIERLLAWTDPELVGLCLDTGHIAYGGGDPAAMAHHHGSRIRHVHLKDLRREVRSRAIERSASFRDAVGDGVFPALGEGDLDLQATLAALRSTGYDGWLVVEQDVRLGITPNAAPLADARRSLDFVRSTLDHIASMAQT